MSVVPDPARLLGDVASALNRLERDGIAVDVAHGAILTPCGYVLPLGDSRLGSRWTVRTRIAPEAVTEPAPPRTGIREN